ncbi:hypothetical protein LDENG_00083800 [Lucifuga dentata]|nr:hypothetical protein LDENG_00083800 [Lucifuga dentata]
MQYTTKDYKGFLSVCERMELTVLMLKQRKGERGAHQSFVYQTSQKKIGAHAIFPFSPSFPHYSSLCLTFKYTLEADHGQWRKSRPCGSVCLSSSL